MQQMLGHPAIAGLISVGCPDFFERWTAPYGGVNNSLTQRARTSTKANISQRVSFSHRKTRRLLVWPWNVLQGHRGWRHYTEHIHDFLVVFYSNFGCISCRLCATIYFCAEMILLWNCIILRSLVLSQYQRVTDRRKRRLCLCRALA